MSDQNKVGHGAPPPAKFRRIIRDIFQNSKTKGFGQTKVIGSFSAVKLTVAQKAALTYPDGFTPLNKYLIYQNDTIANLQPNIVFNQLISFATKSDGYIYGFYYNLTTTQIFTLKQLTNSSQPLTLLPDAVFTHIDYIEMYNDVKGTTVVIGLSNLPANPSSALQYKHKCHFNAGQLLTNGSAQPNLPRIYLTGLSRNLKHK